jgi:lipooligosaccharide transport system permease protein
VTYVAEAEGHAGAVTPARGWLASVVPSPRIAARVWRRDARNFSKLWRGALLPTFLDPLFYLVAMGFGLGTYLATIQGISYEDFIAPGLVASAAMWAAAFETTYNVYIKMNENRLYDALLATPIEVADLVTGEIAWAATRSLVYGTSFLAVITAFGLVDSWWALAIPACLLVGGACFAVIGMAFTALIQKIDLYSYFFTLFITPMFLFSGIFFPLERLPGALEVVAWFTPLYHLVNLMRDLATGPGAATVAGDLAWLVTLTLLLFPLPVAKMRQRLIA